MHSKFLMVLVPLLLSACLSQSGIQSRYTDDNNGCRDYAENNIDRFLPKGRKVTIADRNAQMVTLFSDCMGKQGWQVAKPKKSEETASTAPLPSPSYPGGYPSVTSAARPAASVEAPPAVSTPTGVPQPSVVTSPMQSPPSPPSSWTQGGQPPATYQPTYGSGPGRNF